MKLRERLEQGRGRSSVMEPTGGMLPAGYQQIKGELHGQLIDEIELSKIEGMAPEELREELRGTITDMIATKNLPLNRVERERLIQEILDEMTGLGPIEPLLSDPTITEILINGCKNAYIERDGKLQEIPVGFRDDDHLVQIISRIVSRVGRRIDETSPMVDARLPDGSRVNAIIPPLAVDGPALSIRRFGIRPLRARDLIEKDAITPEMLQFLAATVRAKLNILISGGTGSGKTTLLNIMSSFIPDGERIITIEDAAELQLQQRHIVRLETRPANVEGRGEVRARELVKNSLRMRPDRIIVGEVRGAEVMDMLQAMNTGHDGSMTTVHANTQRDALSRLVTMAGLAVANFSERLVMQSVARAINIVVQLSRFSDGKRRVVSISEITGMEGEVVSMQDIFVYEQTGVAEDGRVLGAFRATGMRPQCMDRILRHGYGQGGLPR